MAFCLRPLNESAHGLQRACTTFISFRCNHGACFCGGTTSGRQRRAWLTKDSCVQRHSPVAPAHTNFGQPSRQFREHAPTTVCHERFACHPQRCFGWHTRKGSVNLDLFVRIVLPSSSVNIMPLQIACNTFIMPRISTNTPMAVNILSPQSKACLVDATDKDDCTSNAYALKFCLRKSVRPNLKTRILMSVIALPKPRQARISRVCNPVFGVTLDPCA